MNEHVIAATPAINVSSQAERSAAAQLPPKGNGLKARWWIVASPLVLIVIGAIVWWQYQSEGTVGYTTVPTTRGAITRTVTATGTVNPELTIIVGTYVSGVIQQLTCDYNTQVKKGQICAKIDPRPYQSVVDQNKANLAVAKAQLEKDQANLEYARLNNDRNQRLLKSNAVSQDVGDNAANLYQQAQAQIEFDQATIEQRQAQLEAAQVNLDYTNIVSPVDGTVVSRNVTIGQTVAASFQTPTLFLIASDLTKMEVDTNVSESDIGEIKQHDAATFTVDAFPKRTFAGTVSQVRQSPQTVQNVVTYDIVVSVDNSDLALKPGMTAATRVVIDQRGDVLRVPNQALRFTPGGIAATTPSSATSAPATSGRPVVSGQTQIWVLRDGTPTAVRVVAGLDDDNFTEIVEGNVQPGDQVIVAEQRNSASRRVPTPRL